QDFIQYKASMLFEASKNDPIKKAETVRDIVNSISKIPDRIKREIYIQECSKIMQISEDVLYSTLAQSSKKDLQEANKQFKEEQKAFDVIKNQQPKPKVDVQYELERKIIQILLLYGNRTEDFEDLILKENDKNELVLEPVVHRAKVFEKIFLDLQEDEMEFTNLKFKGLYYKIIDTLNQNPDFALENFVNDVDADVATEMTTILMEDERYTLSNWHTKNIFPKEKTDTIAQLVNETILNLRCFLISKKIDELSQETKGNIEIQYKEILEEVVGYKKLDNLLSRKLNKAL
ncbi:MAG: DNA primase, partial [Winogradskyella sp.]|nr:DNA primase [Winogradskyella sp.]